MKFNSCQPNGILGESNCLVVPNEFVRFRVVDNGLSIGFGDKSQTKSTLLNIGVLISKQDALDLANAIQERYND